MPVSVFTGAHIWHFEDVALVMYDHVLAALDRCTCTRLLLALVLVRAHGANRIRSKISIRAFTCVSFRVGSFHAWFVFTYSKLTALRFAVGALVNILTSSKRGVPLESVITAAVISANSVYALSLVISWAIWSKVLVSALI
jgi:hypothetical protein